MKKIMKRFGISWITVWLILSIVALSSVVVFATYTGVTSVKRVVSTRDGVGILFSSNYMRHGSVSQVSIEYREVSEFFDSDGHPLSENNPAYTLTVCNFSQGDKSKWYIGNDIKYTLTAKLYLNEKYTSSDEVDPSMIGKYKTPTASDIGDLKFGIKFSGDADYTYFTESNTTINLPETGAFTLSKTVASTDTFSLLFDKSEVLYSAPRFWIYVTAVPTSQSVSEVETISGYVGTCKSAKGGAEWTGFIGDEDYSTIDYDSYNYIISGNGKGDFYFAWDDSKVNPNEFALLNYDEDIEGSPAAVESWTLYTKYGTSAPQEGTWKFIKLNVDSEKNARYEFQLYKTSGASYSENITDYVDYYFDPETSG